MPLDADKVLRYYSLGPFTNTHHANEQPIKRFFLAIESNVSDALARFPMDFDRWTGVDRQLQRLADNPTMQQWLGVNHVFVLKISIEKLTELEKKHHLGDEQKATALKYTARVWEISMIRQMAREITGKAQYELHVKIPTFVRILESDSVTQKLSLPSCGVQDQAFLTHRKWLAGLLKSYGELDKIKPPVPDSRLDAELETIQRSSAQLQLIANDTFSTLGTVGASPEDSASLNSTNMPPDSTAPSALSSILFSSGITRSGNDVSPNGPESTTHSGSAASA